MLRKLRAAALLPGLVWSAGCDRPIPTASFREATEVVVALPTRSEVTDFEEFTGRTDAILSVEIRSRVAGYLEKKFFDDGAEVKEGDLLYQIDDRIYKTALDTAESTVARGEAHRTRLEADYRRASNLFRRGAIGKQEFDRISGDYAEAGASLGAARAQLDTARLNFSFTKIKAPMSGQISRNLVDPGNLVRQQVTLLNDIVAADKLYVYFDLNADTLSRVKNLIQDGRIRSSDGKDVSAQVGLSDEDQFSYTATMNFSENKLDSATGTLRIRGIVTNPRPWILSPGLFVRVRLPIGKPHPTLLVAEEAVGSDQGRRFVYVVDHNDEVVYKPVEVGDLYDGKRSITQGLAPDERIVVAGLQRVRPGSKVAPRTVQPAKTATVADPATKR